MKWFLKSYLGFLLYSLLGYSFVIWYSYFTEANVPTNWIDWSCIVAGYFASVFLTSFVIVKLPVFRNYYNFYGKKDDMIIYRNNPKHNNDYDDEVAAGLVAIFAGIPLGILANYLDAYDAGTIGFACATASCILSFFHEP